MAGSIDGGVLNNAASVAEDIASLIDVWGDKQYQPSDVFETATEGQAFEVNGAEQTAFTVTVTRNSKQEI